jgi:hypothetical protein
MPHQIVIEFGAPTPSLTHRVRNFGEDLHRGFERTGAAAISLNDIDRATNHLCIVVHKIRHLGTATAFIEKTLRQHMLDDVAQVTRHKQ